MLGAAPILIQPLHRQQALSPPSQDTVAVATLPRPPSHHLCYHRYAPEPRISFQAVCCVPFTSQPGHMERREEAVGEMAHKPRSVTSSARGPEPLQRHLLSSAQTSPINHQSASGLLSAPGKHGSSFACCGCYGAASFVPLMTTNIKDSGEAPVGHKLRLCGGLS